MPQSLLQSASFCPLFRFMVIVFTFLVVAVALNKFNKFSGRASATLLYYVTVNHMFRPVIELSVQAIIPP